MLGSRPKFYHQATSDLEGLQPQPIFGSKNRSESDFSAADPEQFIPAGHVELHIAEGQDLLALGASRLKSDRSKTGIFNVQMNVIRPQLKTTTSDPFVKVLVVGRYDQPLREVYSTKVINGTVNPVWRETADFEIGALEKELVLEIFSKNSGMSSHNPGLGCVVLHLLKLPPTGDVVERWFDIEPNDACRNPVGQIRLRVKYKDFKHSRAASILDIASLNLGLQPEKSSSKQGSWWQCCTCKVRQPGQAEKRDESPNSRYPTATKRIADL